MEIWRMSASVTLPGRENVLTEKPRGVFEVFWTSHQLNPRQLKKWHWGTTEVLLIDIKYSLFSFSSLVMNPRKPFVCLSPKCSAPLGCLPTSNRWSLTCSRWPRSCQQTPARPGRPQIHRHCCQGAREPSGTPCPSFCLHWERDHVPSSQ